MSLFYLNKPGVEILSLEETHIEPILAMMNKEGWYYYDRYELRRYLNLNQDCFVLLKNRNVIGSLFTTNYDNQAWIGNIVVANQERGKGLATEMIRNVIAYLCEEKHVQNFRLGSVPLAIDLYKKAGFHAEAFTTAQEVDLPLKAKLGQVDMGKHLQIERITVQDLEAIAKIDEQYFKSNRLLFLTDLYHDSIKAGCLCLRERGRIVGFLMIRRRQVSKKEGGFTHGPEYAYRLGPSCVQPEYGIHGFKALLQKAILAVNEDVKQLTGSAKMYVVFPKNADKTEIYKETRGLAEAMGMNEKMNLDQIFDEHDLIFGAPKSEKNEAQSSYMKDLGFHQEYFEQIMSHSSGESKNTSYNQKKTRDTIADPEGIFASATPGDKA